MKVVEVKKLKKGDKLLVIANNSGHSYGIGTIVSFSHLSGTNIYAIPENGNSNCYFYASDLSVYHYTSENIQKRIKELEIEINDWHEKLAFMEETKSETYDDNVYKVFNTLKIIEAKKGTRVEKAKLIADLIK